MFLGIPTAEEAAHINSIIALREQQIFTVDENIARLRAALDQLLQDRSEIRESLVAHKAMMEPPPIPAVHRLPPEIWGNIFVECMLSTWPVGGNPQIMPHKAPMLLLRICRWWRDVATATPILWRDIAVKRDTPNVAIAQIPNWVKWSKPYGMDISIRRSSTDDLGPLLSVSKRWTNLMVHLSRSIPLNPILNDESVSLKSLDTLTLVVSSRQKPVTVSSTPMLKTLWLTLVDTGFPDTTQIRLAWGQLTTLGLVTPAAYPAPSEYVDLFKRCTALEHCVLSGSILYVACQEQVTLANLHTLIISSKSTCAGLLLVLDVPALRRLHITRVLLSHGDTELPPWDAAAALDVAQRSGSGLEELLLVGPKKPPIGRDLENLVKLLPSLNVLLVKYGDRDILPPKIRDMMREKQTRRLQL